MINKTKIIEEIDKKAEQINNEEEIMKIRAEIGVLLLSKNRNDATEMMVKLILEQKKIYTVMNDEKPEMFIYDEGIYKPEGKSYVKEICRTYLGEIYNNGLFSTIIGKIEADTFIESNNFFNQNYIDEIAVKNGILNIHTKKLDYFDSKKIFFSKLPVMYDETKECNKIISFFDSVLKCDEDIIVMQELFGYLLLKEYKIETAFMFSGDGRNGKGKTIELMKRFIGQENCTNRTINEIEEDLFARGDLINKLANICGDIGNETITKSGWFKALTGRDLISAPRKFKSTVTFTNYAKFIFSANELPRVYDNSIGFWERWVFFEFPYTFKTKEEINNITENKELYKEIDPEIIDKISDDDELSGLLNWSLIGLKRLLNNKDFSDSNNSIDIRDKWQMKANSLKAYISKYIDSGEDCWSEYITKQEFLQRYSKFCKKNKLKIESSKVIKNTLEMELGVSDERKSIDSVQKNCWVGIKFKEKKLNDEYKSSKSSMGSNGIHTNREINKSPIGVNTPSNLTSHTKFSEDFDVVIKQKIHENYNKKDDLDGVNKYNPICLGIKEYLITQILDKIKISFSVDDEQSEAIYNVWVMRKIIISYRPGIWQLKDKSKISLSDRFDMLIMNNIKSISEERFYEIFTDEDKEILLKKGNISFLNNEVLLF